MKDIIEDLFKIYNSLIASNNVRIYQTINEKYTTIDRAMLTTYLYIRSLLEMQIDDDCAKEKIVNYLIKQVITSETGNINLAVEESGKQEYYNKALDILIREKFEYKNRILKTLKYNYKILEPNLDYDNLISFYEDLSDLFIMTEIYSYGNKKAYSYIQSIISKLDTKWTSRENFENEIIYNEVIEIITGIKETEELTDKNYRVSDYYNLAQVVFNLRNVTRYSSTTLVVKEDVLFHMYLLTIICIMLCEYLKEKGEDINIYEVVLRTLFHDFGEFTGNEIITNIKNYNEKTKQLFAEIEAEDEEKLRYFIGDTLYGLVKQYKVGTEGYIAEIMDKIIGIMKIWVEIYYMNNFTMVKLLVSIYQERFRKFYNNLERIQSLKDKEFLKLLLTEMYIYIKKNIINLNEEIVLKYFTKDEIIKANEEIEELERKLEF